jgi:hypothetical protein
MLPITTFGLCCSVKDEKVLIQRVNDYLATLNRTTSKAKQPSLLEARLPFVLKYFYWNLNKDTSTWLEVHRNQDVRGEWFFPNNKECSWIVRARMNDLRLKEAAEIFFTELLFSTQFEYIVLAEGE